MVSAEANPDAGRGAAAEKSGVSRRSLLSVGWLASLGAVVGPVFANVRYLFPNVLYETPTAFKLRKPAEYPPNTVIFEPERRLFIFNDRHGFRAMSAVCTHLRCTVSRFEAPAGDVKVTHSRCPCHGSVFDTNGNVLSGPAPRPLSFFRLTLSPDERLLVDTREVVSPDTYFKKA